MCKSLEYFKTNRPEVDARTDEIAETGRRAKASAGETTAKQVKADLEHHKGMKTAPFPWLPVSTKQRQEQQTGNPWAGFCGVCCSASVVIV